MFIYTFNFLIQCNVRSDNFTDNHHKWSVLFTFNFVKNL